MTKSFVPFRKGRLKWELEAAIEGVEISIACGDLRNRAGDLMVYAEDKCISDHGTAHFLYFLLVLALFSMGLVHNASQIMALLIGFVFNGSCAQCVSFLAFWKANESYIYGV
ncbi:hypothetical protein U1Q18_028513 [Sarracenia purpurea var. burkii]